MRRHLGFFFILFVGLVSCSSKQAIFPAHEVTLVVQSAPGGGSDFVSRTLAAAAEKYLGQKINVINKPGASGAIGMGTVASAKPDGYTIGFMPSELALLQHLGYSDISVDKFELILQAVSVPAALSVRQDSPYKTVADFLADAKKRPGKISVGNAGTGGLWNLGAVRLEKTANIKLKHIPFDGAAPALIAVLGGHIDAAVTGSAEALPHVESGKMRLLGVMDLDRFPLLSQVPTFKEQGFDVQITGFGGLAVPKGTPPEIVAILHDVFKKAFDENVVQESYKTRGFGHTYKTGTDFAKFVKEQSTIFQPLLANLGVSKQTK